MTSCCFRVPNACQNDLFGDAEAVPVPADLGKGRQDAAGAVKVLKKILRDARADLSVDGAQCNRLEIALDLVEQELTIFCRRRVRRRRPKLPFDDDGDVGSAESDSESGAEMKS